MSNFLFLLRDKKDGETSFDSLKEVKKEYNTKKVGHAGTLDKAASGLMIVLVGNATKLNPIFSQLNKRYVAEIEFGKETDTLDRYGSVIEESDKIPTLDEIERILPSFIGKIKQSPPLFSSLHQNGKRLYKLALKGEDVLIKERDVEIYSLDIISYINGILKLDCRVSKGTYIRSLSRDIALSLGTRGSLLSLRRTEIGPFTLDDLNLDTLSLLKKTDLFSHIDLDINSKKYLDNGTIKEDDILRDSDKEKKYAFAYFNDELYSIVEKGDKFKILARV